MKKYVAEFIGTFVLVFVSCGAASASRGIAYSWCQRGYDNIFLLLCIGADNWVMG